MDGNHWQQLYRAALLELDLDKLRERLKAADEAIHVRVSREGEVPSDERIALRDAMSALAVLKRARR